MLGNVWKMHGVLALVCLPLSPCGCDDPVIVFTVASAMTVATCGPVRGAIEFQDIPGK